MSDAGSTYRSVATVIRGPEGNVQMATELALAIREGWQNGKTATLSTALADHPELRQFKSIVMELACDEYHYCCQNGESLSAEEFARRYPSMQHSLCALIEVQDLIAHDLDVQMLRGTLRWPEPGASLLQFKLIAEIGRGTFGRVFLASEPALGSRLVALKVAPHGGEEAEILGRLRHPNIVPVHSVQEDPQTGLTAFCMPYLGNATLSDVLDRVLSEPAMPRRARVILDAIQDINQDFSLPDLPAPDRVLRTGAYVDGVLHLAIQLADALAHSHKCGICHRDLKPSNVLLTPDGRPLLLDFNLSVDERLTVAKIGGTLPYMAPEELAAFAQTGEDAARHHFDPRSDLFSLGVLIYQLLTGHLPFGSMPRDDKFKDVVQALLKQKALGPQPMKAGRVPIDARLARLVESCLAVNPDDRPATAAQFAAALRQQRTLGRRIRRWVGLHPRKSALFATLSICSLMLVTIAVATRPPPSTREYRSGVAFAARGDYEDAIDHFNAALRADPVCHDALVARAHAYLRLGKWELALADYDKTWSQIPSARVNGHIGFCLNCLCQHEQAIFFYRKALRSGEVSAAILNNLGVSYRQLGKLDEAERYLRQAIALDENFPAPHFNLVPVLLNKYLDGQPLASDAFDHARQAERLAAPSGSLFLRLAQLYAFAARNDPSLIPMASDLVKKAVQYGADVQALRANAAFSQLQPDQAFQNALTTAQIANPPPTPQLIEPPE